MCGRYVIDDGQIAEVNKILQDINNKYNNVGITAKTGEIYPTDNAPILSIQNEKPSLSLMTWGFPKLDNKGVIINAKSETVSEKHMFAQPFIQHRCIVLSTGFYEWTKGKVKDKYRFNSPNSLMLYMAGIYTKNPNQSSNTHINDSFVILTRPANEFVSNIHERMPVILYKDELIRWLTDYHFANTIIERDNVRLFKEIA